MREEDFDLLERYFSGDLDAVEQREFDETLAANSELNMRFTQMYDARTETLGFRSLTPPSIELAECFSVRTLERFVKNELDAPARAMVIAHDRCSWCAQQIRELEGLEGVAGSVTPIRRSAGKWFVDRQLWATATAIAASLLFFIWLPPSPGRFRADPALGISATISVPNARSVIGPPAVARSIEDGRVRVRISAVDSRFIGVWVGGESIRPAETTGIPPNLVELGKGEMMEVDIPERGGGDIDLTIVVSGQAQNIAIVEGAFPDAFAPGDEFLAIDGHPRMFRVRIEPEAK